MIDHSLNTAPSHIKLISTLFDNPTTSDVVFAVQRHEKPTLHIFAYKALLAAASPSFMNWSDFLSRAGTNAEPTDWLHADFDEVRGGLDWNGVKPCTAHSMYRLATRYSMKELQQFSLRFSSHSLTIENPPEFDDVQNKILPVFKKHWLEVKQTNGFKTVLDRFAAGELSNARELMTRALI
ncbi:hypothetical protein JCM3766R1_004336 [Sporobolomyces carnicolor]